MTATVTASGVPVFPGLVNFCDATATYCTDIHIVGSAQLTSAGTAVFRFRPGAGSHSYKAIFLGTHTFAAGEPGASSLSVFPYRTITQSALNNFDPSSRSFASHVQGNVTVTGLSNRADFPGAVPTGGITLTDTANGSTTVVGTLALTPGASTFAAVRFGAGQMPA
jgi:Bacterial Ig-like domain (group 3)